MSKKISGDLQKNLQENKAAYEYYSEALILLYRSDKIDHQKLYELHRSIGCVLSCLSVYKHAASHLDTARMNLERLIETDPDMDNTVNHRDLLEVEYFRSRYLHLADETRSSDSILFALNDLVRKEHGEVFINVKSEIARRLNAYGKMNESLQYTQEILKLPEASDKQRSLAYHHLTESFLGLKLPLKAIEYLNYAISLNKELSENKYLFYNYLQLGNAYMELDEAERAITFYLEALEVYNYVEEHPDMYEIYYRLQLAGLLSHDARASTWGKHFFGMNEAFLKKQKEILHNQMAYAFHLNAQNKTNADQVGIEHGWALLKWTNVLTGTTSLILAILLIKNTRKPKQVQELEYDEAIVTARNLLLENYHKIYGAYDKYLADKRCTFKGKKETLRKAMSLNGDYRNAAHVEYVLNDLGEGKFKVKE